MCVIEKSNGFALVVLLCRRNRHGTLSAMGGGEYRLGAYNRNGYGCKILRRWAFTSRDGLYSCARGASHSSTEGVEWPTVSVVDWDLH
jgi:hypothetical protein